jgi:hypothetical protein
VFAVRIVVGALVLAAACGDDEQVEQAKAQQEVAQQQAEASCVEVFAKVESCRDDMLMLARAGPVLRGDPPESAFAAAGRLEKSMSGDLEAQCEKGVPAGLDKGMACFDEDCRALATCMFASFEYPPVAAGPDALRCRDGLPALEAKGQGKVLQWCVMPDGTPHGLFQVRDDAGALLVEGAYDRGRRREVEATAKPGQKWWE